jgi:mRNA interferase MazF
MKPPQRGEVWLVSFDPTRGHEQAGARPAIVLSVDAFNSCGANLVTVLPVTSKPRPVRTRIEIVPPEGGLTATSYVICEQSRTISTERLMRPLGMVSSKTMDRVSDIVRMLLGL